MSKKSLSSSSSSGTKRKTADAEDRLKMAQQYLADLKGSGPKLDSEAESVDSDQEVDARAMDEEIIASRLESKKPVSSSQSPKILVAGWWREGGGELQIKRVKLPSPPTACCLAEGHGWVATKGAEVIKVDLATGRRLWLRRGSLSRVDRKRLNKQMPGTEQKTRKTPIPHQDAILCMAQRGDRLITGGGEGRVCVWQAEQGRLLLSHQHHRGAVTGLAFNPQSAEGEYYSASVDRSVRVWLQDQPTALDTLFGHQDAIMGLVSHPAGDRCLTVGSRDRTARLWRIAEESQLLFRTREAGEGGSLQTCAFLSDPQFFVTGSDDGHLSLWSLGRKKPLLTMAVDSHAINCLYSLGDLLISGHPGWLGLWQLEGEELKPLRRIPCSGHVNSVAMAMDGRCLVVAVGRDERMGRFVRLPAARNELVIISLP